MVPSQDSNPRPVNRKSDYLSIAQPHYMHIKRQNLHASIKYLLDILLSLNTQTDRQKLADTVQNIINSRVVIFAQLFACLSRSLLSAVGTVTQCVSQKTSTDSQTNLSVRQKTSQIKASWCNNANTNYRPNPNPANAFSCYRCYRLHVDHSDRCDSCDRCDQCRQVVWHTCRYMTMGGPTQRQPPLVP